MNRRNFLGSLVAVSLEAVLPTPAPGDTELLKREGVMGYLWHQQGVRRSATITVESMADGFAMVQGHDLAPSFMFVTPQVYKEWNPKGYAELVRLQNEAANLA